MENAGLPLLFFRDRSRSSAQSLCDSGVTSVACFAWGFGGGYYLQAWMESAPSFHRSVHQPVHPVSYLGKSFDPIYRFVCHGRCVDLRGQLVESALFRPLCPWVSVMAAGAITPSCHLEDFFLSSLYAWLMCEDGESREVYLHLYMASRN